MRLHLPNLSSGIVLRNVATNEGIVQTFLGDIEDCRRAPDPMFGSMVQRDQCDSAVCVANAVECRELLTNV